jgi:hypothetical protein
METAQQPTQQPRILSQEERNDLRRRVLLGQDLSLDEARAVYETMRQGQGAAVLMQETKSRKGKKKESLSDEALDADLEALGL